MSKVYQYIKKPIGVQIFKYADNNWHNTPQWIVDQIKIKHNIFFVQSEDVCYIKGKDNIYVCEKGDYIILDEFDNLEVCKSEDFEDNYISNPIFEQLNARTW